MNKTAVLIIGLGFTACTLAQDSETPDPGPQMVIETTTETVIEETTDWGEANKDGHSRLGMSSTKLPGKTKVMRSTTEISQVIDIKPMERELACESDIDLVYYQKDTTTEVRTLFTSSNCSNFDAAYQLRIMYFDADGEIKRITADEQWPAGLTTQHTKTYTIGTNSQLRRVTSRIISCTCKSD